MAEREWRPDYEWVRGKLAQRKAVLSGLRQAMIEDDEYRLMSSRARGAAEVYLSGLPEGFVPSYPPLGQDAAQTGLNRIVSGEEPDVTVTFPKGSFNHFPEDSREKEEREARDLIIRWVRAGCKRILAVQVENVARELGGHTLVLGAGVVYYPLGPWPDPPFGWLPDSIEKYGEKRPAPPSKDTPENRDKLRMWERERRRSYPWVTSVPHTTWVYWDLGSDPPKDYIFEELVSQASIAEAYPEYAEKWPESETANLTRITYVSEKWAGQWCDDVPLMRVGGKIQKDGVARNLSGRPWVQMAFSGMGSKDETGDWQYRVKGSMRDGRDILLLMLKAWNWMAAMGEMQAFPTTVAKGPGAEKALEELEFGAGTSVALDTTTTLGVFEGPKTPEQVYLLWDKASERFAGHFGQPVLSGERSPGEPMGSLRSRAAMAGMPFEAVKVSMEQAFGAMFEHKMEMVKYVLQEAVTVGGVTLRPKDVIDGFGVKIDLTPLTEEERAFKRTAAQDDVKMGAMTVEEYIRTQRQIDDPAAVKQAKAVEDMTAAILAAPEVLELGVQKMVADLTAKLGLEPPMEEPEEAAMEPGSTEPLEMQEPPPVVGGPADLAAQATNGAPQLVTQQAVQAS